MSIIRAIKKETLSLKTALVNHRRHLHMHPELSFKEVKTSAYVKEQLNAHGIKYTDGYCKHGIVAEIKGANKGKSVYLRGDMDALPITEENRVPYVSKNLGIMHACGHDVHMYIRH